MPRRPIPSSPLAVGLAPALALALALAPGATGCSDDGGGERRIPFDAAAYFAGRQLAAQEHVLAEGGSGYREEMVRVHRGVGAFDPATFQGSIDKIRARRDTSDFDLSILLRILHQMPDPPAMPPELRAELEDLALTFKYWIDEPGVDGMVYWSENHHVLFHSNEILAGQLFPDTVFPNSGMTGREHVEKGIRLFLRWAELRGRIGFTEFHSSNYYEEDIGPLVNLVDFAEDPEVREQAAMLVDLLLLDMGMQSHDGFFGGAHGRTKEHNLVGAERAATHATAHLVFDQGRFNRTSGISFTPLMLSGSYVPPAAVILAGRPEARPATWTVRQHMSTHPAEAVEFGITTDPEDFDSTSFWWSAGAYVLPEVVDSTLRMAEEYGQLEGSDFFAIFNLVVPFARLGLADDVFRDVAATSALAEGLALTTVNTVSHHNPHAMLGSVQDKYAGQPAAQNHSWTAVLGADETVFTTHPLRADDGDADWFGYYTGGLSQPRVGQDEDVAIALYDPIVDFLGLLLPEARMTHAYFPFERFDETRREGDWTFAREGEGYLGLYSRNPTEVATGGRLAGSEILAPDPRNVWICEIGWSGEDGSFDDFVRRLLAQEVSVTDGGAVADGGSGFEVVYASDRGPISFSWTGPLTVGDRDVPLADFPRLDGPFGDVEWKDRVYDVRAGGHRAVLDFDAAVRTVE